MANYFFAWAGIWNNEQYSVPRQPKLNKYGENGRNCCTINSIHIHIIFFKDRVDKGGFKINYDPTQIMLANYFTKPIKEKVSKIFRYVIMGYKPISSLE